MAGPGRPTRTIVNHRRHARARQRSLAELKRRHEDEFAEILERHKFAEGIKTLRDREVAS